MVEYHASNLLAIGMTEDIENYGSYNNVDEPMDDFTIEDAFGDLKKLILWL